MALTPGSRLAEYEILALIGAGGMGEVYRARDTKLGREVAIKVLPEAFSRDKDRLTRFEREARLLASVNHPGIATLHGFEKSDGVSFLVMELVEGETLEARIERGPIPIEEALPLFLQMAEAMEAAHTKGVIHRDLKPANMKITLDGRPKILDFGLAKGHATPESNVSESPTLTRGTSTGIILGTAPYMSPEQARGKPLDKRTDIWSFGCVLYEALTARRAFDGDSVADILGAIVKAEPDWVAIPKTTPRRVRELLRRCLHKDVRRRLRDMGEAWVALDEASVEEPQETHVDRRSKTLAVMTVVTVIAAGLTLFSFLRSNVAPSKPVTITEISLPPGTELARGISSSLAISPDARHVAFVAKRGETTELYLRALDEMEAKPIDKGERAEMPFFSPDGEWLGFYSNPEKELMKVSVSGGAAVTITETRAPRGASWGLEDRILFNPASNLGLARVSATGGEAETVTSPDRERRVKGHRFPRILPGGQAAVFTLVTADTESFDDAAVAVVSLETGDYEIVLEGGESPRYSPSGHLVYARGGSLLAVPFDLDELRVTGTPVPVLDGVSMAPFYGSADFSLSGDGTLLYAPGDTWGQYNRIVWVDRRGRSQPLVETPRYYQNARLSPDGSRLVIGTGEAVSSLWVYDLHRNSMSRVAFGWDNLGGVWTPDGRQITFMSNRSGVHNLYQIAADGTGPTEWLSPGDHLQVSQSWSPDGTVLAFVEIVENDDIWLLSMDGERKREPFLRTEFNEGQPVFSPNGRWIAYQSDESGQLEVYVRPYPVAPGKWPVSTGGGRQPSWTRSGEIFYRNDDTMMVVEVAESEEGLTLGKPIRLFDWPLFVGSWDVAPDGQRFVMIDPGQPAPAPTRLRLIMNWGEELKRLVPTSN